jgi:hypothetical protein
LVASFGIGQFLPSIADKVVRLALHWTYSCVLEK